MDELMLVMTDGKVPRRRVFDLLVCRQPQRNSNPCLNLERVSGGMPIVAVQQPFRGPDKGSRARLVPISSDGPEKFDSLPRFRGMKAVAPWK